MSPCLKFLQTTLPLFHTYSWPNTPAFSSFAPLSPYSDPTFTAPLNIIVVRGIHDFHGARSVASFPFLPCVTLVAPNFWHLLVFGMLSFLGFPLSWFFFPPFSGYSFSISSIDSSSWTKSKCWTLSGFGLNWVLSLSLFLGQGAMAILGKAVLPQNDPEKRNLCKGFIKKGFPGKVERVWGK